MEDRAEKLNENPTQLQKLKIYELSRKIHVVLGRVSRAKDQGSKRVEGSLV